MPNIIGEQIPEFVAKQINKRQNAHGSGVTTDRTPEEIMYLNSKTAWVKLASGISISDKRASDELLKTGLNGKQLAKNYVLFNGTSNLSQNPITTNNGTQYNPLEQRDTFSQKYNVNATNSGLSEFGYVPMPGIESADIKSLNRGSIKRATIKIKCYSPEQFQILDLLYLRIGYTMLLEWGNSLYLNNNTGALENMGYTLIEAEDGFFSDSVKTYYDMLPKIKRYRKDKFGNYDALVARVVNFSWQFAQDGSYDITLELLSVGDVIESLKTNVTPGKDILELIDESYVSTTSTSTPQTQITPPSSNVISSYLYYQSILNSNPTNYSTEKIHIEVQGNSTQVGHFIKPVEGEIQIPQSVKELGPYSSEDVARRKIQELYPGAIERTTSFTNPIIILQPNEYNIVDDMVYYQPNPVNSPFTSTSQEIKDVAFINYVNSTPNDYTFGYYIRFEHLIEIIRTYVLPEIVPDNGANQKLLKIDSEVFENLMYNIPFQVSLDPQVCLVNGLDEEVGTKKYYNQLRRWKHPNKPGAAFIMNIYIHHQFIDNCLNENLDEKGNLSIFNFLNSICVGLNKALGGVNGLETIIDAEEATIRIIDTHYYEKQPRKYGLELYGYNTNNNPSTNKPYNTSNFVRNFNLKTEITPEFASMASISSTAGGYVKGVENTMFSKWCWGLTDRLQPEVSAPISTGYSSSRDEVKETYLRKFWWAHNSAFGMKDSAIELDPQIIENNVAIVSEFYKSIQSEIQIRYSGSYASPTNGFIPISLGVTMDGIGGIKIYNELNVATRFLPQNYPDNLHFIIKGVNHKLSNSDWETSVETVVIANGDGENQKQIPYEELRSEVLKILGETNKEISIANASSITPQGKVPDSARYIIEKILSVAKYDYGITDKERLTAILAVAGGETQYGVRQFESFNYNLDGARSAFSKIRSLPTQQSLQYIPVNRGGSGSQQKLANLLYGGMYGNNNNGDGWKYRGRGLSQVTFKSNYENIQSQLVSKKFRHLGNILTTPDLVATYEDLNVCILVEGKIKGWFGKRLIPNSPKYLTDAIAIQQLQNGGTYAYNPNTTPNYAKALAAINNTPWVQSLINQ